jgi:hypothetical protein
VVLSNTYGGIASSHDTTNGSKPKEPGSMYTMPQRLTVAGLATDRSSTSKIIDMVSDICNISPLFKHNFLLSSKTVFMFSI